MGSPIPARAGELPAVGARRRLQALAFLGHDIPTLAAWCGTDLDRIDCLIRGRHSGVAPHLDTRIAAVFERYCMTFGDSVATAEWARRNRWASGLAWFDIDMDDATAKPDRGAHVRSGYNEHDVELFMAGLVVVEGHLSLDSLAARDEAVRRLTEAGLETKQVCDRIGCIERTVLRTKERLEAAEPVTELVAS